MTPILEGKMFKTSLLSYLRFQKLLEEQATYLYRATFICYSFLYLYEISYLFKKNNRE